MFKKVKLKHILPIIDREFIIKEGKFTTYETNLQTVYLCFPELLNKKVKKIYSDMTSFKVTIVLE